jgi:hypothetical protein
VKTIKRVLYSLGVGAAGLGLIASPAFASDHHWANTHSSKQSNGMKVYWCAGGSYILKPGAKTGKNICAVQVGYNHSIYAYDSKTGTLLYDFCNTSDSRKVNFTTKTDSSNTVEVLYLDERPDICI